MKIARSVILIIMVANVGACTNLANNLQDPAIWERVGEIGDRYAERDYERNHAIYELDGDWVFTYKGVQQVNTVRHGNGGIMVIPDDGGKAVFYKAAGRNLYRSGNATYHFYSRNRAEWSSRGTVIQLQRIWE